MLEHAFQFAQPGERACNVPTRDQLRSIHFEEVDDVGKIVTGLLMDITIIVMHGDNPPCQRIECADDRRVVRRHEDCPDFGNQRRGARLLQEPAIQIIAFDANRSFETDIENGDRARRIRVPAMIVSRMMVIFDSNLEMLFSLQIGISVAHLGLGPDEDEHGLVAAWADTRRQNAHLGRCQQR